MSMTNIDESLKPCPMCGTSAKVVRVVGANYVLCMNWLCSTQGPVKALHADAIAAWNTRAPQPAPMQELAAKYEALVEKYAALSDKYCAALASRAEPVKDGQIAQLQAALRSVNAVAIERGDKYGACDQIDNDGAPYQSQWLADLLAAPTSNTAEAS
jgi:hypothetical protein